MEIKPGGGEAVRDLHSAVVKVVLDDKTRGFFFCVCMCRFSCNSAEEII